MPCCIWKWILLGFSHYKVVAYHKNNPPFDQLLPLTLDKALFEKISLAKKAFISILSLVGNTIPLEKLARIHINQKGIKISQGNELQGCPYQVLDIVRDFDVNHGLNLRVLHWWGRGAFLFIYFGSQHPKLQATENLYSWIKENSFNLCKGNLWDYKRIIDEKKIILSENIERDQLIEHLKSETPFQIIKPIPIVDRPTFEHNLVKEITEALTWMDAKHI